MLSKASLKIVDISLNGSKAKPYKAVISKRNSDSNWTWTHNHLVRKRTLNHLAKLASLDKWLSIRLQTRWLWLWNAFLTWQEHAVKRNSSYLVFVCMSMLIEGSKSIINECHRTVHSKKWYERMESTIR